MNDMVEHLFYEARAVFGRGNVFGMVCVMPSSSATLCKLESTLYWYSIKFEAAMYGLCLKPGFTECLVLANDFAEN